jgi:hypothetical protein
VESCWVLDANYLATKGCLDPGWSGTCQLAGGNEAASISLHCETERLRISWRSHINGDGEQEGLAETISIVRLPWRFGGSRPYFLCPGNGAAGCGRRVAKLYLACCRFRCRHCSQLAYASQYEQPWQRAFRRAGKLWQRLDITGTNVPGKPKGMLVTDYARLLEAALLAETHATECTARLQQLATRAGRRKPRPTEPQFTL